MPPTSVKDILATIESSATLRRLETERQIIAERKAATEKFAKPLRQKIEKLTEQKDSIDEQLKEAEKQLAELDGTTVQTKAKGKGKGKGTRLKHAAKAEYVTKLAAWLPTSAAKAVGLSEIADHLGLEAGTARTILKAVSGVSKTGDKRSAKYHQKD